MRHARRVAFVSSLAVFMLAAAVSAQEPPGEGRPLPEAVRLLLWNKVCDLAYENSDVDCSSNADPARCGYKRSNGEAFEPGQSDYARSFRYAHFGFGDDVLAPTAQGSGWTKVVDEWGDAGPPAFEFLTGLTLMTSTPYQLAQLTPEALAWIGRELVPAPEQAMCGKTAGELYEASFKTTMRATTLAWEHVKKSGKLKGLKVERLAKEQSRRGGATWTLCAKFAERNAKTYDQSLLQDECRFWLRRGAAGQADAVASILGTALQRLDPTFYAAHEAAFAVRGSTKKAR